MLTHPARADTATRTGLRTSPSCPLRLPGPAAAPYPVVRHAGSRDCERTTALGASQKRGPCTCACKTWSYMGLSKASASSPHTGHTIGGVLVSPWLGRNTQSLGSASLIAGAWLPGSGSSGLAGKWGCVICTQWPHPAGCACAAPGMGRKREGLLALPFPPKSCIPARTPLAACLTAKELLVLQQGHSREPGSWRPGTA